jgi:hypothetical protein
MNNNEKDDSAGGEFTRLFRSLQGSEPNPAPSKPDPLTPKSTEKPSEAVAQPRPLPTGASQTPVPPEQTVTRPMTRLFSAKAQPQRPERASTPSPFEVNPRAGEFTRIFKPTEPESPTPVTHVSESPVQPGEFTRMFSVPTPPKSDLPKPPPEPPQVREESFTEFFQAARIPAREKAVGSKELETKPAPAANKAEGDFTVMFGRPKTPPQTPATESGPEQGLTDMPGAPKSRAALFDTTVYSDEFAKVIGESRPRPTAPAQPVAGGSTPTIQPNAETAKKKTLPLWILGAILAVVLILTMAAIYVFVIRS